MCFFVEKIGILEFVVDVIVFLVNYKYIMGMILVVDGGGFFV